MVLGHLHLSHTGIKFQHEMICRVILFASKTPISEVEQQLEHFLKIQRLYTGSTKCIQKGGLRQSSKWCRGHAKEANLRQILILKVRVE